MFFCFKHGKRLKNHTYFACDIMQHGKSETDRRISEKRCLQSTSKSSFSSCSSSFSWFKPIFFVIIIIGMHSSQKRAELTVQQTKTAYVKYSLNLKDMKVKNRFFKN